MKKFFRLITHFKTSIIISWKASPWIFSLRIFYEIISVILPIYISFIIKNIIDIITINFEEKKFISLVIIFGVLQLTSITFSRVSTFLNGVHNDKINNYIKMEILKKVSSLDISYFDNPEFYNEIQNANRDSKSMQSLTWIITSMMKGIVQIISCGIIIFNLHWSFPFIFFLLNLPSVFIDKKMVKKKYDWQLQRVENERKIGYIEGILQNRVFAQEIRVFNTKEYLLNKHQEYWKKWNLEKNKIEFLRTVFAVLSGLLPFFIDVFIIIYLGFNVFYGTITIGSFTYYRSIVSQYKSGINAFLMTFNSGYESEMKLTHYKNFLSWKSNIEDSGSRKLEKIETIDFENVSFQYPNTNIQIIKNISLHIGKNEKLALVGLNGAGKTTLIKLLLRLYEPSSGKIYINKINISEYSIESLRKQFGIIFQEFCRYNFTLREMIAMSDISQINNDEQIIKACDNSDIDVSDITIFPDRLETVLGKIFKKDGVELSVGQWQKLAIGRSYFNDSSFMIMDEPNSALDPEAENRVLQNIAKACHDKGGIIITHRLSSISIADKIAVINSGIITEYGTHEELMEKKGEYYKLFTFQSSKYQF